MERRMEGEGEEEEEHLWTNKATIETAKMTVTEDILWERMEKDWEIDALWKERDEINLHIEEIWKEADYVKCREEALQHIECHDENKYRKKNKGFLLPFNTKEKESPKTSTGLKYKYKKPKDIDRIKQEVKKLKEMRQKFKDQEKVKNETRYTKQRQILKRMNR